MQHGMLDRLQPAMLFSRCSSTHVKGALHAMHVVLFFTQQRVNGLPGAVQ